MTTDADQPSQPDKHDVDIGDEQRHPTAPLPSDQPTEPAPTADYGSAPAPPGSTASTPAPPPLPPTGGTGTTFGAPWSAGPPPGYEQPGPRRPSRLQRSSSDRVLTGVCGGLGQHTGIDPILFRIGFVALVFAAGTGVLLYLALAVVMPRDDGQQIWTPADGRRPSSPGNGIEGPNYAPAVPNGPRSPVPGVTLAVLLIGVGVIALGERYGNWSLAPSAYFGMAVAAVGMALLVSAFGPWRRRKAGLITLGLILSFGLFVTSTVDDRGGFDQATFGENSYRPASTDQISDSYQVVMGQATLDLSHLEFNGEHPTEIQVNVTMGNFEIFVPPDADLRLNSVVAFGSVSAFGNRDVVDAYYGGFGDDPAVDDSRPGLVLNVDVRFGNAEVSRVG